MLIYMFLSVRCCRLEGIASGPVARSFVFLFSRLTRQPGSVYPSEQLFPLPGPLQLALLLHAVACGPSPFAFSLTDQSPSCSAASPT